MTYKIFNGPKLMAELKKQIAKADCLDLAVAFWGKGAGDQLGLRAGSNARLICNLDMGGTNPAEIRSLIALGCDVRCHSHLHTKLGIIGSSFSFLGSSNISANGLGFEGAEVQGWEEANVAFDTVDTSIQTRFAELWTQSDEVNEAKLMQAEEAWRLRQRAKRELFPKSMKERSFLEVFRNDPQFFSAKNWHVVVTFAAEPKDEKIVERGHDAAQDKYGTTFEVYWDWDALPKDATLVDFLKPTSGPLRYNGIYRRLPEIEDFEEDGQKFQPAVNLGKEAACNVNVRENLDILKAAVSEYVRENPSNDAYLIKIEDLANYLG